MARSTAKQSSILSVADLGSFYVEHKSGLVLLAFRFLRDKGRAEEVVQDAFVRVILACPELEDSQHALAYFRKVVQNLCLDIFRLEGRIPKLVSIDPQALDKEESLVIELDHSEVVASADDAAIVRQALAMLSPAERSALVMWEIEGRTTNEISKRLGIKESSVRHTVSRARGSLRRALSELIIDETRGLTALDLLSVSFKKTVEVAKKSSKIALSFILLICAFLSLEALPKSRPNSDISKVSEGARIVSGSSIQTLTPGEDSTSRPSSPKTSHVRKMSFANDNVRTSQLRFAGLDKNGIPVGFTVTDSLGSLGNLYMSSREPVVSELGLSFTSIVKTSQDAANIFITQTVTQDKDGLSYQPIVAFGQNGAWTPTISSVLSTETERLLAGNYLLTAVIRVKSSIETMNAIPAAAGGRDLEFPPIRVITRILLDPSKSKILAQAIQVVEKASP